LTPSSSALSQRQYRIFGRALTIAAASVASLLLLVVTARATPASAQPSPAAQRGAIAAKDSLRIYLMTMDVGDDIYELFGHDAIWVHDPTRPIDTVYNWGVFDFNTPGFVPRFLLGDMRYMMTGDQLDLTIAYYKHLNRHVWAQELDLTDAEKQALVAFVRWNVRPENATYRYNYYRDNCSTRVRDAIDRVTGGQVRAQLKAIKTDQTYRSHSLRLMQGMKPIVVGVDLLLGRPTDFRLTADEASLLPVELMNHLRTVKLDGGKRPLFKNSFVVNESTRPPETAPVPQLWKGLIHLGLALAALVVWLGRGLHEGRRRRVAAFTISFLAAVLGILGLIITLLVTVTDHIAAHANENMVMLEPLWLVVAAMAPVMILRGASKPWVVTVTRVAAAVACGAVLIHLVGLSRQPNWDAIGLLLPVELALTWVLSQGRTA